LKRTRDTLAESDDEDADMVCLPEKRTGIRNTLFAKGLRQRAPWTGHQHSGRCARQPQRHKCQGLHVHLERPHHRRIPPKLVEQYKRFIELNREALIDYRECRVDSTDFLGRIVSGFERMRKRQNKYTRGEGLSLAGQFDQLRHLNAE
jgi:hypothetical protein